MSANGWLQILLLFAILLLLTRPLGHYLARVFERESTILDPVFSPVERLLYRLCGIDAQAEMTWIEYGLALLAFSLVSMLLLYLLQRLQVWLPLNPEHLPAVPGLLALNTAASFTTNTNWQAYTPETTMSYLTQMAGLAYHNFASAAVGLAVAAAVIRGIARREQQTLGNFWVDLTRVTFRVLLPAAFVLALILVSQGVVQNLRPYDTAHLVQPTAAQSTQRIAQGPVASQEAIKELGTNGGGFFNANSAHPFENPTPLTNFLEILAILLLPAALTATLGRITGSPRHGWAVFAAMSVFFFAGILVAYWAESAPNPLWHSVSQHASVSQSGGNMEGKEVRFGIANSSLFAVATTDTSCGAVNAMHDSFTPLGGLVVLTNMLLGEVVFGGVGSGIYGMIIFVVLAVFIAGLMVGRTPEYLGKKIEAYDVKMAMLYTLIFPLIVLTFAAISLLLPHLGLSSLNNSGPHGLTEILYAYTSAAANNGSAFAGLNANTDWYNLTLAFAMLAGRFLMIVPVLALAGNLASKRYTPPSQGTFPVTTPLFAVLLVSVILIVVALTFFPALSLGPVLEHLLLHAGHSF